MSNDLAIATVTATLMEWVRPALEDDLDGAGVAAVRPDQIDSLEGAGVNFFLYQTIPNPAYRNDDLPTRRADGNVVRRPQAALDLHYLLTFYGSDLSLEPQRAMGSVVRTLHARPVFSRQAIETTIGSATYSYLAGSDLAEQIERVKITPITLNLEELSKLWTMFVQTAYRLSMAYVAKLVLIEADAETPQPTLPVRRRNIYVRPFRDPCLEKVAAATPPPDQITSASTLVFSGRHLRGEVTRVRLGEAEYTPTRPHLSDTRITIDLATEAPSRGSLRAGVQGAQVIHRLMMGTPGFEHEGIESNVVAVALRPRIRETGGVYDIQVSPLQTDSEGNSFRTVTLRVRPDVGRRQRVVLLLNEYGVDAAPEAYRIPAEPRAADGDTLTFVISPDISGEFLFRVQVDGAQSPLVLDENEASPTYHRYVQPRRSIP
ncbi:MAG TPA: DUF4255 domain-containing protein [Gammaproteobacteria bacterium]|nr:DUF4255 domain-containing protein [Gammaproteobacteria bacterium]